MKELMEGQKVIEYYFFAEREGIITRIEKNRFNKVLGTLPDMVFVKFEDDENETGYDVNRINFEKPERWNGHGTFVKTN